MLEPRKQRSLDSVRRLLGEALSLHGRGASGARLGRTYGVADGYMLALMDLGVVTQKELGVAVAAARAHQLRSASPDSSGTAAEAPELAGDGAANTSLEPAREGTRAA